MADLARTGLLLINLGTPASPAPRDVRPYLDQFLMDPRVIDVPALQRALIVKAFILPFRPKASGEAYATIWTDEGSPLLVYSERLAGKVQERLGPGVSVRLAMRYGDPSIPDALQAFRREAVDRIVVMPLYPQYSSAATGSSLEVVYREAAARWNVPNLAVVPPFYDHPAFLDVCVGRARPVIDRVDPELVFFSFHGVPERQIRKGDDSGTHCLASADCCAAIGPANASCYRAQCVATARLLADALRVPEERRVVCFQSRLGRTPWIRPYTDEELARRADAGARRAVILSPAFVADCLETIEELGMRGLETWREHGGETLELVPSLNDTDAWADAVVRLVAETSPWIAGAAPPRATTGD